MLDTGWSYREALRLRQKCVDRMRLSPEASGAASSSSAQGKGLLPEVVLEVADILERAALIYWEDAIFDAAIVGSEVFEGKPLTAPIAQIAPQFWCNHTLSAWEENGVITRAVMGYLVFSCQYPELDNRFAFCHTPIFTHYAPDSRFVTYVELSSQLCQGELIGPYEAPVVAGAEFLCLPCARVDPYPLSRQARREAERKRQQLPDVRKVVLRKLERSSHSKEDGSGLDYQWQWLVGGHWRNQWYASEGVHRPLYIAPYLKGPEDKPFKPRTVNVFHACR